MRILHLLNHTNRLNGHVHAAVDLACAQRQAGHAVAVASGGGDFDDLLTRENVESFRIDHRRSTLQLARSTLELHRLLKRWQADVVHAHMMTSAVLAWPACRVRGLPLVTTVHNAFERSAILMGLGTRVIAVSKAVEQSMRKRGLPGSRLRVVLNGTIGSARFKGRDRTPKSLGPKSILFVGGQHPRKGLPELFEAFQTVHARHPDSRLFVVGDGPCLEEYRATVAKLTCASAVEFVGAQDDPFPWMLGAAIFVLPSRADPAPLVLPEAREAGCAIVATAVDGIPELLDEGQAGQLVPPRDPGRLAEVIGMLLDDRQVLEEWRAKSHSNLAHLSIDRVAEETIGVYRDAGVRDDHA